MCWELHWKKFRIEIMFTQEIMQDNSDFKQSHAWQLSIFVVVVVDSICGLNQNRTAGIQTVL